MINLDFSLVITIFYIALLYLFMNRVFFRPISKILETRRQLIAGGLEEAKKRMQQVESKAREYDDTLKKGRTEMYRLQEVEHEQVLSQKADLVAKAKAQADTAVREGRARFAVQAETARQSLENEVDGLAEKLTRNILTS